MEPSTRPCQNCQKDFTIDTEDFNYYEKIKVPPPTWCPECRLTRRWSASNVWNLYWRNCNLCETRTMSMYSPENPIKVYCPKCWWGDTWDGTEYAMDYDPSRPFLEQVKELSEKTPYVATETLYTSLKNSDYSNAIAWAKNCYQTFWSDYCENVYYSSVLNGIKDTADSLRVFYGTELCYEGIGIDKSYRIFYSQECADCTDVWFSRNCYNCMNCVGCVNLRGASYQIFNQQYSKEDYFKKIEELKLHTRSGIKTMKKEVEGVWKKFPYRYMTGNTLNLNVTGEYVYESKNSKNMYNAGGAENCKHCQFLTVHTTKDSMDYSGWGNGAEGVYECVQIGENVGNVKFSYYCTPDILNLEYCIWNTSGKNNFGCVNLKRKSYCILNKEYSKEDYEKLRTLIIEDMKKNPYVDTLGRKFFYGEFFPPEMSRFPYNDSIAMRFFPKTKEEAVSQGYLWKNKEDTNHLITVNSSDLPDSILETTEEILKETIGCEGCGRAYKITRGEFDLLRKLNLPVPDNCPKCRENARFTRLQSPRLYDRQCMKCSMNIITSYSPDKPEIVYCEKCYQAEFA